MGVAADAFGQHLLRPAVFENAPGVRAGFSLRTGGVSSAPFDGLNLGRSTDDAPEAVDENRRRFFGALGFAPEQAALAGQVHGIRVRTVEAGGLHPGYDALVTATPGVLLCILAADCAAVLLADPDAHVVGACHAGWRGAAGGIVGETVQAMKALGADSARIRAFLSPCISRGAFEVGPEVAGQFALAHVSEGPNGRPHVDLKGALLADLEALGVPPGAVEVSPHCTAGDAARFFSHRASGGRTGRMMGAIGMLSG